MTRENVERQAHDLAVVWSRREFDIHTEGIPVEEWDKVDESIRMDKLLSTYQDAYAYFHKQLLTGSK